jgi:hypothetical protein
MSAVAGVIHTPAQSCLLGWTYVERGSALLNLPIRSASTCALSEAPESPKIEYLESPGNAPKCVLHAGRLWEINSAELNLSD